MKTKKLLLIALAVIFTVCTALGLTVNSFADATNDWIKITPTSKYIYTLDAQENKETFTFNAANNCNGKILMIDLGTQADGETAEADQCYILSKIQIVNFANVTSVTVEVSTDGENYIKVVDTTDLAEAFKVHEFNEINARYVKITPNGAWATLWGAEYVVAFWGRAGQLAENKDPKGITISGYNSETIYPMVKGDTIQINASKINATGDGEITYAVSEAQSIATISSTGLLEITGTGDGQTQYTVTASVPKPEGGSYTAQMKFVVLEKEFTKITDIYAGTRYELLDFVGIQLVRVNGTATVQYSVDGVTYTDLTTNALLETPVCAQFLKVNGGDLAVYGIKNYDAATIAEVTSQDINGFYPEHPLTNLIDGKLDTMAQTPRGNFLGTGDVKGSITVELDAFYDISGVRVFSFWNSLGDCSVSFSYDGKTFTGEEYFNLSYCSVDSIGSEYYAVLIPFNPASAKYVRINIYGFGPTSDDFLAMREITVYGTKINKTVTMTYNANTDKEVAGIPAVNTVAFGTAIEEPIAPQLTNYVFGGWYEDAKCKTAVVFPYLITENTSVYAKWTELPKYTVTSTVTGQGAVTGVPDGKVYKGTRVTLTISANEGWRVKEVKVNDTVTTLTGDKLMITITENIEITATFEVISENNGSQDGDNGLKDEEKGCGSSIGAVSALSVIFTGVAAFVLKRKES